MTAEQARWFLDGLIYMNIHTGLNPDGEIRAQLAAVRKLNFVARLNGANERPNP
ncbi:MAG: CHRD domain-containing protein, partial [Verrucomicrobia bacterium]